MGAWSDYWAQWREAYDDMVNHTDPRIRDNLFINDPVPPALIVISYLLFIFLGPVWMKDRKPFVMKEILVIYNFGMVLLSAYIVKEYLLGGWLFEYSLGCQPVDYSYTPNALRVANATWLFYIAKFIELLDTVFFILRKKNNQVTFLHVFHHGCLPMFWYWGIKKVPGGFGTFHALVNAFVHVVMYFYYGLACLGPKFQKYLWWKKYVTILQLTQFFIVTIHNSQFLFIECDYPWKYVAAIQGFTTAVAILFLNFYIQTYKNNKKPAKVEPTRNGAPCSNGYIASGHIDSEKIASGHAHSEKIANGHVINGNIANGTVSRRHVLSS